MSRYGDNCWDFSVEYPNLRPRLVKIRFEQIYFDGGDNITMPGYGYLYSVKEYCYSLLVDPPASYPKLSTICVALNKGLRNLLRFMRESGIRRFSDIGDVDFSEFQERISSADNKSGGVVTNRTIKSRVYALSWLYEQSGKLSDGLTSCLLVMLRVKPSGLRRLPKKSCLESTGLLLRCLDEWQKN